MQIKTTLRYQFTLVRMTIFKKTSASQDVQKREHLCTVDGNVNWYSLYGKHMEVPYKIKTELPYDLEVPLPGIYI